MIRWLRELPSRLITRLIFQERGATAVEYAVMVALIAAVIILAVLFLGQETSDTFSCAGGSLESQGTQNCP